MTRRATDEHFAIGDVSVYPLDHQISSSSGVRALSPIAMELLCQLAHAQGAAVANDRLIQLIWGANKPDDGALEHYVAELNHQFDPDIQESALVIDTGNAYQLTVMPTALDTPLENTKAEISRPQNVGRIEWFLEQLRKRKVSQTGVLYLVAAWLLLQFSDASFEALGLGDGAVRLILITAVIGFPITLALSWFYDVKPANGRDTGESTSQRAGYVLAGALVAIPLAIAYQWLYTDDLQTGLRSDSTAAQYQRQTNSIAVLAFTNLGNDDTYDYFGDGIAEEIINALSSTGELLVAPRTSSFLYKDKATDMRGIGEQLGVQYVLEGSVRRVGERIRVIATLVNTTEGFQTWSSSYNQDFSDIFDVQQDISQQVVQSLNIVLSAEKNETLGAARTSDIQAYDFYLQGREYLNRPVTQSSLNGAIRLFNSAIEIDRQYSDPYAGLCEAYLKQYAETNSVDWFSQAEDTCTDTLRFDLKTVELRVALGSLYLESGEYKRAQQQLKIALDRDPDSVDALSALARTYVAIDELDTAEELFLKSIRAQPRFWKTQEQYGSFLFQTGRPEEAIKYYQLAIEMTPDNAAAYNNLGAALLMSNQFDEAANAWKDSLRIEANESASSNAGTALFLAGKFDEAATMYLRAIQISKDKHILWGNLADAQWFGSNRATAQTSYRNAIALAEEALQVNENDLVSTATLAHYYSRVGENEPAEKTIARATAGDTSNLYVWYYAALTWLTLDREDLAVQSLSKAIELGYPKEMVLSDAGLRGLTSSATHRSQLGL